MKVKIFIKLICIAIPAVVLLGCTSTGEASFKEEQHKQQAVYKNEGTSFNSKYYYCYNDGKYQFKVFDEATQKTEFLCKKNNCKHDENDKSCNSYSQNTMAFIPIENYLYVFIHKYESLEPGYIDRIDLATGERALYSDGVDFDLIYNAYAAGDKIYFSDQAFYTANHETDVLTENYNKISTIKAFDIENKSTEIIANVKKEKGVIPYISAIDEDMLYYQEYYQYSDAKKQKAFFRPKNNQRYLYVSRDIVDNPSFYYYFIDDTSLFTYDLTNSKATKTVSGIENFGLNYYNRGFYFLDEQNNTHRVDWLTGKDEIVVSNSQAKFNSQDVCELSPYTYNVTLNYISYTATLKENSKENYIHTVSGRYLYDINNKAFKKHDFDNADLQSVKISNELINGYIVNYTTKEENQTKKVYITKQDFYEGNTNFIGI